MPRSVVAIASRNVIKRLPIIQEVVATAPAKKRKRRSRRGKSRRSNYLSPNGGALSSFLACLNDPFECPAVRLGFGTLVPTTLASIYLRGSFSTSTDGSFSLLSFPSALGMLHVNSAGHSAAPGWVSSDSYGATNFISSFGQARCLAGGIRLFPMLAATQAPGMVALGLFPSAGSASALTNACALTTDARFGHPFMNVHKAQSGASGALQILWRPEDVSDMELDRGQSMTSPVSNAGGLLTGINDIGPYFSMAGVALGTSGTATLIYYEIIYHFECTLSESASTSFIFEAQSETTVKGEGQVPTAECAYSKVQNQLAPLSAAIADVTPYVGRAANATLNHLRKHGDTMGILPSAASIAREVILGS